MSIAKMKKVTILSESKDKRYLLDTIKALGVVHIKEKQGESGERLSVIKDNYSLLENASHIIENYLTKDDKKSKDGVSALSLDDAVRTSKAVLDLEKAHSSLLLERQKIEKYLQDIATWDNVSETTLDAINSNPFNSRVTLSRADKKILSSKAFENIDYVKLPSANSLVLIIGDVIPEGVQVYPQYRKEISDEKSKLDTINASIKDTEDKIRAHKNDLKSIKDNAKLLLKDIEYEGHFEGMLKSNEISYLTGYIPQKDVNIFKNALDSKKAFAYMIEDAEGEETPTLLITNNYTNMLSPVLGILGISPGYEEKDISFWFLSFFAVFFAMIIGDAAYGLVILAIGVILRIKQKHFTSTSKLVLLLGACTFIWGAITGTWFGSEAILKALPFLKKIVIPSITNFPNQFVGVTNEITQNSMMRLSFSLGALQLCLACVLNVIQKAKMKDLSLVADIGWFSSILSLYLLALILVVGANMSLKPIFAGVGIGFLLVLFFSGHAPGLSFKDGFKKSLGGAFSAFLNTISAFGNVMSYIRLFAVGIASVAISESFNGLASGLLHGPLIIFGILILVIGHSLNFVLGILSVVVHGVRLNVMEFSSQCGIEWAGIEYHPFK